MAARRTDDNGASSEKEVISKPENLKTTKSGETIMTTTKSAKNLSTQNFAAKFNLIKQSLMIKYGPQAKKFSTSVSNLSAKQQRLLLKATRPSLSQHFAEQA